MPPINQQGSRAGLITGLVVFVILFVISAVFAFQFYGKSKDADQKLIDLQKQYKDYVTLPSPGASQTGPIAELLSARGDAKFGATNNDNALEIAIKELGVLQQTIAATTATVTPGATVDNANRTLKDAQALITKANVKAVTLPPSGLEGAITTLAKAVVDKQQAISELEVKVRDTAAQLTTAQADIAKANEANDAKIKELQATDAGSLATAQAAAANQTAAIAQMTADNGIAMAKVNADKATSDAALAAANQALTKANTRISAVQARLAARRVDVTNAIIRQSDAKIVRVPNNDVCYISLGYGDQITAGLTFEVYDKTEGVPPIPPNTTGDEQLPAGKASIEITHVGTVSSECRIVKLAPGAVITEGDVIANLVYDPHTKYNFLVYGKFDLAGNGRPNDADADVMKRLVTQWGGKLIEPVKEGEELKLSVNTDFVVLGAEPVIPVPPKDEQPTAEFQDKVDKAKDASNKYAEIKTEAEQLHIPIMNQNRFLYYVGFYDQAKR